MKNIIIPQNIKESIEKFIRIYSKIGKANHYIVLLGLFLLFNFVITRANLSIGFYLIPIILGFILNMIFSNNDTFLIEVNNSGVVEIYEDVKYKLISKKNQLIIFQRDGRKTTVTQGNYTIKPFIVEK